VAEALRINFLKINYADLSDENSADDPNKLAQTISNRVDNLESCHRTQQDELIALKRDSSGSESKLHEMLWSELLKLVGEFDLTEDRPLENRDNDLENLGLGGYYTYQVACKRIDIRTLQANLRYLGPTGLLAWDEARHSQVVRFDCGVEYLSEADAKQEIQLFHSLTRAQFKDWIAFGNIFLVGLEVFRGGGSPDPNIAHFRVQMP
jgi:hypothetical protein